MTRKSPAKKAAATRAANKRAEFEAWKSRQRGAPPENGIDPSVRFPFQARKQQRIMGGVTGTDRQALVLLAAEKALADLQQLLKELW